MDGAGGNDGEDGIATFFCPTHGVSHPFRFAYGSRYYLLRKQVDSCEALINKNTTPERGVVSATYPNDTSAARCIGRRQRHTIHMSSHRQVSASKARHRRGCES